jgi:hypothetical protein
MSNYGLTEIDVQKTLKEKIPNLPQEARKKLQAALACLEPQAVIRA